MSQWDFNKLYEPVRGLPIDEKKLSYLKKDELVTHLLAALTALKQADETICKQSDVILNSNEVLLKIANKPDPQAVVNNSPPADVQNMIRNEFELERKKTNVCVYGLNEDNVKPDKELFSEILTHLQVENIDENLLGFERVGKKQDGKIRPLIVKTPSAECKKDILKNAPKLKNLHRNTSGSKVYIAPDLTFEQRAANRRKREEAQTTAAQASSDAAVRTTNGSQSNA